MYIEQNLNLSTDENQQTTNKVNNLSAAFILNIISIIFVILVAISNFDTNISFAIGTLVPLIWAIPMTKKIYDSNSKQLSTAFKVCNLLFVNLISGILLLCQKDDTSTQLSTSKPIINNTPQIDENSFSKLDRRIKNIIKTLPITDLSESLQNFHGIDGLIENAKNDILELAKEYGMTAKFYQEEQTMTDDMKLLWISNIEIMMQMPDMELLAYTEPMGINTLSIGYYSFFDIDKANLGIDKIKALEVFNTIQNDLFFNTADLPEGFDNFTYQQLRNYYIAEMTKRINGQKLSPMKNAYLRQSQNPYLINKYGQTYDEICLPLDDND